MKITNIIGREIIDSRANPTVEVEIEVDGRVTARASVPSGASTGKREALELRDNDPSRYGGKGVLKTVNNINEIIKPRLIGMDPSNQKEIDAALISLDGTNDKSFLGANAILGVSLACARVAAKAQNKELFEYLSASNKIILPKPMMNVLNGGAHASSSVDFQEYMIMPCSAKSIKEAIRMGSEVFHSLKKILKEDGHITAVGDEGGFAPNLKDNEEPLKYLIRAIEDAGYIPGEDFVIALDIAASEFYEYGLYYLKKSTGAKLTTDEMIEYIKSLCLKYPIISVEDGLSEDDWDGWKKLTAILGDKIQLVGDDLFVTNPKIIEKGIKEGVANAVLIKINQIGTISETIEAINLSKVAGYNTIISHRSGETEDTSIADIACALNLGQIKTGSVSRTDRTAKYNQLIRIEEKLSRSI